MLLPSQSYAVVRSLSYTERMRAHIESYVALVEQQIARLMDHYCQSFSQYRDEWGSRLPSFCVSSPTPTPSPSPLPTETPTPTPTPTPSPTPSPSPTETPTPSPTPTPTPTPSDNLYISEVFYDVDAAHGAETNNEWVEVYNDSNSARDVSNYMITDAASSDTLPADTVIPAHGYLVVTNTTSTAGYWSIPSSAVIVSLGNPIGGGLANNGDAVYLKNDSETTLDAVSWGTNVDAFDPSTAVTPEGSSIVRTNPTVDTNTASDWSVLGTPTPGQ